MRALADKAVNGSALVAEQAVIVYKRNARRSQACGKGDLF